MKTIKFEEIKSDLLKKINVVVIQLKLQDSQGFTLIEGFFNPLLPKEISKNIVLGGSSVPMIAVMENSYGRLHFFALKKLLPELFGEED